MHKQPHKRDLREVRLLVPDARSRAVRRRAAVQVTRLNREDERTTLEWIEAVSDFDADRDPSPD